MRLAARAYRRYWFSQDVTKGRLDYVGPGPLGRRMWVISFSHTCVMMFHSMTSVVIMRGAHELQKATRGSLWKGMRSFQTREAGT